MMIETTRKLIFGNPAMLLWAGVAALILGGLIVTLYRIERGMIRKGSGVVLTVLRVVLLVLLLLMLTEPIISMTRTEPRKGALIVLVDNSRSMQIPDRERPDYEKLRIADALGMLPEGVHRSGLAACEEQLAALLSDAEAAAKRWAEAAEYVRRGVITDAEEIAASFDGTLADAQTLRGALTALLEKIDAAGRAERALPDAVAKDLAGVRALLAELHTTALDEIIREMGDEEFRSFHAIGRLQGVNRKFTETAATLAASLSRLRQIVIRHDSILAADALERAPEAAGQIDASTRLDLAGRMLTAPSIGLLRQLKDNYNIKGYVFSRRSAPFPIEVTEDEVTAKISSPESAADALYTNLSASLQKAVTEAQGEEIGGVIILSDGRFNQGDDPLKVVRNLGRRVALYPVVVGSTVSPRDIAVIKIAAADVVHEKDVLSTKVLVQAAGFRGRELDLIVSEKNEEIARKKFTVPKTNDRTVVKLDFVPLGKGKHHYTVTVPVQQREAFTRNNERVFAVSVLDKKLKVLMVDGGPRWEFRYLKNALLRDKRLEFKYLLLDPLSTSQEERARALKEFPKKRKTMFSWDTIILGDVDPASFSSEDLANLEAFVNDRGGTMIVIAGRRFMPAAYGKPPFGPVLPIIPEPSADAHAAELPPEGFPLKLTTDAREHTIFRLSPDEQENLKTWEELPKMMWYAPVKQTKPGTLVWAYAGIGDAATDVRKRPVIASHAYGLGRVFYMGSDGTWRWRYKVADKYFHQFWGQVILWATSGKLPVGTDRVKLGTDKFEYIDGEDVIVRVRVLTDDKSPMADAMVRATLTRKKDDSEFATMRMEYLPQSGGHYETAFADVPTGSYTLRLKIPGMEEELKNVSTDVNVKDAPTRELTDLSADAGFMKELASRTGGRAFALDELARLPEALRPLKWTVTRTAQTRLWNHWILLTVFCVVVTVEWVLRKVEGLL